MVFERAPVVIRLPPREFARHARRLHALGWLLLRKDDGLHERAILISPMNAVIWTMLPKERKERGERGTRAVGPDNERFGG